MLVKVFYGFVISILSLILVVVLVAGYFGFVPGLSNIFGSNKPVNLGTTFTPSDYQSAITKSGVQIQSGLQNQAIDKSAKVYGPAKAVNVSFTAAEALAYLNLKPREDVPFSDWQLRINSDNTVEISADIAIDQLANYATANGIASSDMQTVLDTINKVGAVEKQVPFYAEGEATVTNGQLDFNISNIKIGRVPIPADQINSHKADIVNYFNQLESDIPGFSVKNASIINGQIHFDGTLPSSIKLK